MKCKLTYGLGLCVAVVLIIFAFTQRPVLRNSAKSQKPAVAAILNLKMAPGRVFRYEFSLNNHIGTKDSNDGVNHNFQMRGDAYLTIYSQNAEDLLCGIKLERLAFESSGNSPDLNLIKLEDEVYFTIRDGRIQKFYAEANFDPRHGAYAQTMALALQLPTQVINIPDQTMTLTESSMNGDALIAVKLKAPGKDRAQLEKTFIRFTTNPELQFVQPSQAHYEFDLSNGQLVSFQHEVAVLSAELDTGFRGKTTIKAHLLDSDSQAQRLTVADVIKKNYSAQRVEDVNAETPLEREQRWRSILEKDNFESLSARLEQVENLEKDTGIFSLLRKFEALLVLYPETGKEVLQFLEGKRGARGYEQQMTLAMGALRSMEARFIEHDLVAFIRSDRQDKDRVRLGADALAGLQNSGEAAYQLLRELSESADKQERSIGFLTLGSLSLNHANRAEISDYIRDQVNRQPVEERATLVAALANTQSPQNLEIFSALVKDSDINVSSQAASALSGIPTAEAFTLIRQILKTDHDPSVHQLAAEALSGHVLQTDFMELADWIVDGPLGVPTRAAVLSLLPQRAMIDPKAKVTLERVKTSGPPELRAHAEQLLLVM